VQTGCGSGGDLWGRSCDLRLAPCSFAQSKEAVERWHYSRRTPSGSSVRIGVWEDERFIGAILFGQPNTSARFLDLPHGTVLELQRVALDKHQTPVSRIARIALRLAIKQKPETRLFLSYADAGQGHHGGIYQAMGWTYTGLCCGHNDYLIDSKLVPGRTCNSRWGTRSPARLAALGIAVERVIPTRRRRYCLPLDTEIAARITPLAQPYPRRERLESEAPANPGRNEDAAMQSRGPSTRPEAAA
jgi:hypothetical protein